MESEGLKGSNRKGKRPMANGPRTHAAQAGGHYHNRTVSLVCNGSDFTDMEDFGKEREEWPRNLLELPNGIPDSDTLRRVFERLDPKALSEGLYDWLVNNGKDGSVIALTKNQPGLLEAITPYLDSFREQLPLLNIHEKGWGSYRRYPLFYLFTGRAFSLCSWVRCHWSIENQLHWCLDVILEEDGSRAGTDMSPLSLNVLRKAALSLCKSCKNPKLQKSSLQKRRFRASPNPETFLSILLGGVNAGAL